MVFLDFVHFFASKYCVHNTAMLLVRNEYQSMELAFDERLKIEILALGILCELVGVVVFVFLNDDESTFAFYVINWPFVPFQH